MKETILFELLKKSKENKELISIWQYNSDKGSLVGYVTEFNEDFVVFNHFTKFGKPDGTIILNSANIKTIDFNDDYIRVMECLIQYSYILDKSVTDDITFSFIENWQIDILQQLVNKTDHIASFEINSSDFYTGFVKKLSSEDFVLNCIGKNGENEGHALYKIEDVTEIRLNDMDDKRRLLLYKWRNSNI